MEIPFLENDKLVIEVLGEKTRMGMWGFWILLIVGYFNIFEPVYGIFFTGLIVNSHEIFHGLMWIVFWAFVLGTILYQRNSYFNLIEKFYKNMFINSQVSQRLKKDIINNKLRIKLLIIASLGVLVAFVLSLYNYLQNPSLYVNTYFTNKISGGPYVYGPLVGTLHWVMVLIEVAVAVDLFVIIFASIQLPNKIGGHIREQIDPMAQDKCGGMKPIGDYCAKLSLLYFLGIILLTKLFLEVVSRKDLYSWIMTGGLWLLGIAIFIYPMRNIKKIISNVKKEKSEKVNTLIKETVDDHFGKKSIDNASSVVFYMSYLDRIESMNEYPVNSEIVRNFVTLSTICISIVRIILP